MVPSAARTITNERAGTDDQFRNSDRDVADHDGTDVDVTGMEDLPESQPIKPIVTRLN
jgi:hypothetical protein